jgi:uncharacterized membrane protein (GlpM family)
MYSIIARSIPYVPGFAVHIYKLSSLNSSLCQLSYMKTTVLWQLIYGMIYMEAFLYENDKTLKLEDTVR